MKTIEAFKCEFTGGVFEDQRRAQRSEFYALMKRAGGSLPAMGSIEAVKIMEWLANNIESEIYPTAPDKLREALNYFEINLRKKNFTRPAASDAENAA